MIVEQRWNLKKLLKLQNEFTQLNVAAKKLIIKAAAEALEKARPLLNRKTGFMISQLDYAFDGNDIVIFIDDVCDYAQYLYSDTTSPLYKKYNGKWKDACDTFANHLKQSVGTALNPSTSIIYSMIVNYMQFTGVQLLINGGK